MAAGLQPLDKCKLPDICDLSKPAEDCVKVARPKFTDGECNGTLASKNVYNNV